MENKSESVNKVKPTDKTLENTAALELVAETSEQLKNTVDKNTTSVDRNAERMKQLEQRLAAMSMPVIRYSEDKPEAVQQVPEQVKKVPVADKQSEPKIQRKTKPSTESFGSTIADAGKKFAGSVMQAGADFGKSMTDQIGSELIPFYSDMKAAAGKVVGGAVEAGKIVKSKFEKKVEEKKERVKDTRAFIPQSTVEKTEKIERVKELREKIVERKREHSTHKIISLLDDIRDKIRAMMLVGLFKAIMPDFSGFGSAIGKFAGMFTKGGVVAALFATMSKWGKDFLKSTGDAFSKIGAGIKDTFNKSMESVKDGWKKMFPDKKAIEPASPNKKVESKPTVEKTPVLDKDGKPVLDKDGKPKLKEAPKAFETVETKAASKFETKATQRAGQTIAIEGAELAGKDALKGLAARSGARAVAGAAGGPIGEAAAALWMIADFLNTMVEWITGKSITDRMKSVGPLADENTSLPEVKSAQTRGTGVPVMASGAPAVPLAQVEQLDEKAKAAVQKREDERTKAMMSMAHSSGTNVNNSTVVNNNHAANIPSPFVSDAQQSSMVEAFGRAFRRN